jgi:hypothetical protein
LKRSREEKNRRGERGKEEKCSGIFKLAYLHE